MISVRIQTNKEKCILRRATEQENQEPVAVVMMFFYD
jgi:hypothetical protein